MKKKVYLLLLIIIISASFVSALSVEITDPQATTYDTTSLSLNIRSNAQLSSSYYSLNGGANVTLTPSAPNTTITASEGSNTLIVWANDTSGNQDSDSVTFTLDLFPRISVTYPSNNCYLKTNSLAINYTTSNDVTNCWWTNNSGVINYSLTCGNNLTSTFAETSHSIKIYVKDSSNKENSTSLTVNVDTTAPTLTLTAPSNAHTAYFNTSSSVIVNFTFSVSETTLSSCSWSLNGGDVTLNSTTMSASGNIIQFTFSSAGTYNSPGWYVSCTDLAGNSGESEGRTITISEQTSSSSGSTTSSSSSSSSESGGSTVTGTTHVLTKEQCEKGANRELEEDDKIKFEIELDDKIEKHYVIMNNVTSNSIDITIESDPINATLGLGELKKFDLNKDDFYDLEIRFISVTDDKAKLSIKTILEEEAVIIEGTEATEESVGETEEEGNFITGMVTGFTGTFKKLGKKQILIAGVFIAVIAVSAVAFILFKKPPKKFKEIMRKRKEREEDIILKNAEKIKAKREREEEIPNDKIDETGDKKED